MAGRSEGTTDEGTPEAHDEPGQAALGASAMEVGRSSASAGAPWRD